MSATLNNPKLLNPKLLALKPPADFETFKKNDDNNQYTSTIQAGNHGNHGKTDSILTKNSKNQVNNLLTPDVLMRKENSPKAYKCKNNKDLLSPKHMQCTQSLAARIDSTAETKKTNSLWNGEITKPVFSNEQWRLKLLEQKVTDLTRKLQFQKEEYEKEELKTSNQLHEESNKVGLLQKEKKLLEEKLLRVDHENFNEVKSVYDKYISLQNQYDQEKVFRTSKINQLEEVLSESSYEKGKMEDTIRSLSIANEELTNTVKNFKEEHNFNETMHQNKLDKLSQEITCLQEENQNSLNEIQGLKDCLAASEKKFHEKCKLVETLQSKVNTLIKDNRLDSMKQEQKVSMLEQMLKNNKTELSVELRKSMSLEKTLEEKKNQVSTLEQAISQMRCYLDDITNVSDDQKKTLTQQIEIQKNEVETLQYTCKTLQTTNESLNVRLSSLNEILRLQESSIGDVVGSKKNAKLLNMWRQKVYSLLVMLKTFEIRECGFLPS